MALGTINVGKAKSEGYAKSEIDEMLQNTASGLNTAIQNVADTRYTKQQTDTAIAEKIDERIISITEARTYLGV